MNIFGININKSDIIPPVYYKFLSRNNNRNNEYFVHESLSSYSQYQEDLILDAIFNSKPKGFYIDVGANDPVIFNNTKRFYDRGWSGINIEPSPSVFNKICKARPNDINLNIGVGPQLGEMPFYIMSADTLSSFNKEAALASGKIHGAKLLDEKIISVLPLSHIFKNYIKSEVDFLSVDAEGFDLEVLSSNDWKIYRPQILLVEINQGQGRLLEFLSSVGYTLLFSNGTNGIFCDVMRGLPNHQQIVD
jgi:FkbM family methyltransferase